MFLFIFVLTQKIKTNKQNLIQFILLHIKQNYYNSEIRNNLKIIVLLELVSRFKINLIYISWVTYPYLSIWVHSCSIHC